MKIVVCFLLVLSAFGAQSQVWPAPVAKDSLRVYLITRGTSGKTALIAQQFNRYDRCASHVGIGIFEHNQLAVYHVTNEPHDAASALVKTTLEDFVSVSDIEYWGIWRGDFPAESIPKLQEIIKGFTQPIAFDFDFDPTDDHKLYCSEFCAKALCRWNPNFDFKMSAMALDPFYAAMLDRKKLNYWPVDFFQDGNDFVKVFETNAVRP